MEAKEVKVVVVNASGIQSKKKGMVCKASVIFGVGGEQRKTMAIGSNNPEWKEEATFEIPNANSSILFTLKNRLEVLGEFSLPLRCLKARRQTFRRPLQPTEKCLNPKGELVVEAWVTKYVENDNSLNSSTDSVAEAIHSNEDKEKFKAMSLTKKKSSTFSLQRFKHSFMSKSVKESSPELPRHRLMDRRKSKSYSNLLDMLQDTGDSSPSRKNSFEGKLTLSVPKDTAILQKISEPKLISDQENNRIQSEFDGKTKLDKILAKNKVKEKALTKQDLISEIETLKQINNELLECNKRLQLYIEGLLKKVIEQSPDLLEK